MFETKRVGETESTIFEYTIAEAKLAGLAGKDNWLKRPKTMLRWRCCSELARLVYPEVTSFLHTQDELRDVA